MTLREQQILFARLTIHLYDEIINQGYDFTYGETWRDPRIAILDAKVDMGIVHSLHIDRLAVDINLFKDGKYLDSTADHTPFGSYWKTLHPLARWGGDFSRPDGNHYSLEWQGRK
jgi:hypothetical protein